MFSIHKNNIEELYHNKAFSILKVPVKESQYLAFSYDDFKLLVSLLKEEQIIICSIELYTSSYQITAPNFWYHWDNLDQCFKLIEEFLGRLNQHNTMYYVLEISSNDSKSLKLKTSLDKIASTKDPLPR